MKVMRTTKTQRTQRGNIEGARCAPAIKSWCSLCLGGLLLVLFFSVLALPAFAQDALDDGVVTADEVNMVARRLYCPVCPNERLDACQTQACADWRDDIRVQLEAGKTEDQIVADFVARYGERAAGVPIDPTLNALSVYTPYVIAVLALVVGVFTFLRRRKRPAQSALYNAAPGTNEPDQAYRSALERDVEE